MLFLYGIIWAIIATLIHDLQIDYVFLIWPQFLVYGLVKVWIIAEFIECRNEYVSFNPYTYCVLLYNNTKQVTLYTKSIPKIFER